MKVDLENVLMSNYIIGITFKCTACDWPAERDLGSRQQLSREDVMDIAVDEGWGVLTAPRHNRNEALVCRSCLKKILGREEE